MNVKMHCKWLLYHRLKNRNIFVSVWAVFSDEKQVIQCLSTLLSKICINKTELKIAELFSVVILHLQHFVHCPLKNVYFVQRLT